MRMERKPKCEMIRLPNNAMGQLVLKCIKDSLNKERYAIRVRGRKPKIPGERSFRWCVPLKYANELAIYIDDKSEHTTIKKLYQELFELKKQMCGGY